MYRGVCLCGINAEGQFHLQQQAAAARARIVLQTVATWLMAFLIMTFRK